MADSCALARQRLVRFVGELRTPAGVEKITTGIKAMYVGGIKTPMRAVAGNVAWAGTLRPLIQAGEAGVDALFSVTRSAMTGGRVKPHEFREVASALDAAGIGVMARGFVRGTAPVREAASAARGMTPGTPFASRIARFVREVSERLDADGVQDVLEHERVKYQSPIAQTMVDAAFGVLEAADRPFWRMSFDASVYAQSKLNAIREGLSGDARAQASARYFEAPTSEMLLRATDDANYATFKDRGLLSRGATGLKRTVSNLARAEAKPADGPFQQGATRKMAAGAKVGTVALEQTIPFTGVPSSIAGKSAAMSPLGPLSLLTDRTQAQRARTIANVSAGAALMYAGARLFEANRMTLATPRDATERGQWEAEGRLPFAVRIGDRWVSIAVLGPGAAALAMGGMLAKTGEDDPEASVADQGLTATATVVNFLSEQSYLEGIRRVLDVRENEKAIPRLVASQIPTPAILGQIGRAMDHTLRRPEGLAETLAQKVPGGTRAATERLDPFGQPVRRDALERVGEVVSPFPSRRATDDPILAELRRLRLFVGHPSRTLSVQGKSVERSREEYDTLQRVTGPAVASALRVLFDDPVFRTAPDEEKRQEIRRSIQRIRDRANDAYRDGDTRLRRTTFDDLTEP